MSMIVEDGSGICGAYFYLWMHNAYKQIRSGEGYYIQRKDGTDERDATINAGCDVIGMLYTAGYFFAKHGKLYQLFFAKAVVEQHIGTHHGTRSTGGRRANTTTGFDVFANGDIKTDGFIHSVEHGEECRTSYVFFGVGGQMIHRVGLNDDAFFINQCNVNFIAGFVQGKA